MSATWPVAAKAYLQSQLFLHISRQNAAGSLSASVENVENPGLTAPAQQFPKGISLFGVAKNIRGRRGRRQRRHLIGGASVVHRKFVKVPTAVVIARNSVKPDRLLDCRLDFCRIKNFKSARQVAVMCTHYIYFARIRSEFTLLGANAMSWGRSLMGWHD